MRVIARVFSNSDFARHVHSSEARDRSITLQSCDQDAGNPKVQRELAGEFAAYFAQMDTTPGLDVSDEEYARIEAERLVRKAQGIAETRERMECITADGGGK